jgi:hypothetical protein
MPPLPSCFLLELKGFYDLHNEVLSPPTHVLPPQRVDLEEYIYRIMLDPVASTMPQQYVPLCPNGSGEEQRDSVVRFFFIKCCPSTSSAPTTTVWTPNLTFDLPLYNQQRCCDPLHTVQLSVTVH